MDLNYKQIRLAYHSKKYPFFETGRYNVNIFGIRNKLDVDMFNDFIGVVYKDSFGPQIKIYNGTTDPGLYWLKNDKGNINGTFILGEGYHRQCWKLHKHHGKYECLGQAKSDSFWGYRDNDKDSELDMAGPIYRDVVGLNLHTTSHLKGMAEKVGAYSAGCQVINKVDDFNEFMRICKISMDIYGPRVSYALFNVKDF